MAKEPQLSIMLGGNTIEYHLTLISGCNLRVSYARIFVTKVEYNKGTFGIRYNVQKVMTLKSI